MSPTIREPRPERGVGQAIYDLVQVLRAENPGEPDSAFFANIAAAWSMKPGTVAANYYRIARAKGDGRPRKAKAKARPYVEADQAVMDALENLTGAVHALVTENVALRARLSQIEKAVGK